MLLRCVAPHTVVGRVNSVPAGPPSKHKQCPDSLCVQPDSLWDTHPDKRDQCYFIKPHLKRGSGTGVGGRVIFPGKIRGVYSVDFVGTEREPLRPAEAQWMERRKKRGGWREAAVCLLGIKSCQIHKFDKDLHPFVGIQHPCSFPLMSQA